MVGDFVSLTLDPRNQFRVTPHSLTDKKESGFGVVSLENLQHLGRKNWVRTIIKRKGNERAVGSDSILPKTRLVGTWPDTEFRWVGDGAPPYNFKTLNVSPHLV
jgi:hypothetical protein